jgi:hypothetical protein
VAGVAVGVIIRCRVYAGRCGGLAWQLGILLKVGLSMNYASVYPGMWAQPMGAARLLPVRE